MTAISKTTSGQELETRSRSAELRALRDKYVSAAVSHSTPVVAERAHGAEIWDVDGKRYIDFAAGIGTLNVGHTHPAVVAAATRQLQDLTHAMFGVTMYESYIRLAEALAGLTPGSFDKKTVLVNSGAEAVENAVKVARAATGRPGIIRFSNAFHGRTSMAMALTDKDVPYRAGFGPFPPDVWRVPLPYDYRPSFPGNEVGGCLSALEATLAEHEGQVAGIIFEPIQGEGGFIVAPDEWMIGVAELARQHGVVLIADEIQTGFGRTGRWFATEYAGIEPDIVVMAKSIAGGLPLGAVTGRAELMDAPVRGGLGGTFGGNPVSCAAALAVIETMRSGGFISRAVEIGDRIQARFEEWHRQYPLVGDVRGRGAMMAIELVRNRDTKEPADTETGRIIAEAARLGLVMIGAGTYNNVIRVLVPLVATPAQVDEGLDILQAAIETVIGA